MLPAPGLVSFLGTNNDLICGNRESLREIGGVAANHADGQLLGHELGGAEDGRHGAERLASIVEIQTGHDDPFTQVGQLDDHRQQVRAEELTFVDGHQLGAVIELIQYFLSTGHGRSRQALLAVRNDAGFVVPGIGAVLEDLHAPTGDLGPADPLDQFFAFAAEHGAADHFDPTCFSVKDLHAANLAHMQPTAKRQSCLIRWS